MSSSTDRPSTEYSSATPIIEQSAGTLTTLSQNPDTEHSEATPASARQITISIELYQTLLQNRIPTESSTTQHFTIIPHSDEARLIPLDTQPNDTDDYDCFWIPRSSTQHLTVPTNSPALSGRSSETSDGGDDISEVDIASQSSDIVNDPWRNTPVSIKYLFSYDYNTNSA